MEIIWTLHHRLRSSIPKPWIKSARNIIETYLDIPWRKSYYSQFGEDAILQNILASRAWAESLNNGGDRSTTKEGGFYVDVGAFAPKQYSNTYWFYRNGWRGINIDATPGSMKIFRRVRRRDINIEAAISDREQELTFYSWGTPTVCNTLSAEHAARFTEIIGTEPQQIAVTTRTLRQILDDHLPHNQPIDFFSIDAESHSLEVLRSNDWVKYRPTIVIVEVDEETLDGTINAGITDFMVGQGYEICAWTGPSVFFMRVDAPPEGRG
jgi:FkbM family methyltransferase